MKIALLGGTFDPVHSGHLHVAEKVADAFATDEVHFIPAFHPPHKSPAGLTSAFHRVAMVALAIAPFERFRLSTIELDAPGQCYTVDTLQLMNRRYPEAALLFVTGTDMFAEIQEWKDFPRLFHLASFAVVNRPGFPMRDDIPAVTVRGTRAEPPLSETPRVYYLPQLHEDISSTRLRERSRTGPAADDGLPPAVRTYISRHQLYS